MKKILTAALLAVILCLVAFAAFRFRENYELQLQQDRQNQKNIYVNPAPPDPEKLQQQGISSFTSRLPLIMLDTRGQKLEGREFIPAKAAVFDGSSNDIQGSPDIVLNARLRLRGSSPELGEKKQYRLNLVKNSRKKKPLNYGLLGMEEDDSWVLAGPYQDSSRMRNALACGLAGEMLRWAPDSRLCELFIDGQYQGIYLAVEAVTPDKNRLNLSKFGLLSGSCPYIARRENPDPGDIWVETRYSPIPQKPLVIKYPDQPTQRQLQWIQKDLEDLERVLYSDRFADPEYGYCRYLDTQNFIDTLILSELAMNPQLGGDSCYCYRNLEGKLCLTVWDFNRSFNNSSYPLPEDQWIACRDGWFQRLVQDRGFVQQMEQRYLELRQGVLSEEAIFARIDEMDRTLREAADRDAQRWGQQEDLETYDQAVENLKATISRRLAFMDGGFPALYQGCVN